MDIRILVLSIAVVITGANFLFAEGWDDEVLRGDANNDGSVTTADYVDIHAYLYLGGDAPSCMDQADSDDSGEVDNGDIIYILQYTLNNGPPPPAPFPNCGTDPTADTLSCVESQCN